MKIKQAKYEATSAELDRWHDLIMSIAGVSDFTTEEEDEELYKLAGFLRLAGEDMDEV